VSGALGALAWLAAPWAPLGSPPPFGSIEHVFLFLPLVAAPLALLLATLLLGDASSIFHAAARLAQPVAAAMVLAAFLVARGAVGGGLTAGWLLMAGLAAAGGIRAVKPGSGANLSNVSLLAAHLFLPLGAVWLLLSRLGVRPRAFSDLTVFLAALHFHFGGFTLQILIAATGRLVRNERSRLGALHRVLALGAIAGIPIIAAGNALPSPALKLVGVALMVLGTIALAVTSSSVAFGMHSRTVRRLLLASATSLAAAMVVAGVYGAGELTGSGWIDISRMVEIHGLLNTLGFTLCGLGAHLHLRMHRAGS